MLKGDGHILVIYVELLCYLVTGQTLLCAGFAILNLVDDTVVVSVVCDERTLGWESWLPRDYFGSMLKKPACLSPSTVDRAVPSWMSKNYKDSTSPALTCYQMARQHTMIYRSNRNQPHNQTVTIYVQHVVKALKANSN